MIPTFLHTADPEKAFCMLKASSFPDQVPTTAPHHPAPSPSYSRLHAGGTGVGSEITLVQLPAQRTLNILSL